MSAGRVETGALTEAVLEAVRSTPVGPAAAGKAVVAMVSDELVKRWESAYGEYRAASELVSSAPPGDLDAAERMALASQAVATAWRDIAAESTLPWWTTAAVTTAAQAFQVQAQDWAARVRHGREPGSGGSGRRRHSAWPATARGGVADAG